MSKKLSNTYTINGDIVTVKDNNNREFIVDLKGYEMILEFDRYWYVNNRLNGREPYVDTRYEGRHIKLHNFLMKPQKGFIVDHIDGNATNNKFDNLRIVTPQQNAMNKAMQINNTSGHKGVHHVKRNDKWVARISFKGKRIVLGTFDTFEEAVEARKIAEEQYFGEFNRRG